MASESKLPPGEHSYESILGGVRDGRYRFARIRAASGRLNFLIGVSPEQYRTLREQASENDVAFAILGSRVSGPRVRQKTLSPILERTLKLVATKRSPSPTYPGAKGVRIEKTAIKEYGVSDVRTSDINIFLIDHKGRAEAELARMAEDLERKMRGLECPFPVKVFPGFGGRTFRSERDFIDFGAGYLRGRLPEEHGFPDSAIESAFGELYTTLNVPRPAFHRLDAANGLWNAALASASFSIALGFHWIVPVTAFGFGFCGRYLARFKAWVARVPAETFSSNTLALLADAGIGVAAMAALINPIGGYGIPLGRILWASALHSLSKGSVRLALDKHFSQGTLSRQRSGVFLTVSINFLQGLATAYIYAGSRAAILLQIAMALTGLALVYRAQLARLLRRN